MIPTKKENPKGLYAKYFIQKIVGWREVKNTDGFEPKYEAILKQVDKGAEYFIMRLDEGGSDLKHIASCRIGIHAYANAIESHLPELAKDLRERYPLLEQQSHSLLSVEKMAEEILENKAKEIYGKGWQKALTSFRIMAESEPLISNIVYAAMVEMYQATKNEDKKIIDTLHSLMISGEKRGYDKAVEAAKAQALPSPVWVKASERLPKKSGWYHIENTGTTPGTIYYQEGDFMPPFYKWLDESALPVHRELLETLKEYNQLLTDELSEVVSMVAVHGWRSTRFEKGKLLREKITELEATIQKK